MFEIKDRSRLFHQGSLFNAAFAFICHYPLSRIELGGLMLPLPTDSELKWHRIKESTR